MTMTTGDFLSGERWVRCPNCAGPSLYAPANVHRPFCSERCKQADLGAWASEQFVVAADASPADPLPQSSIH